MKLKFGKKEIIGTDEIFEQTTKGERSSTSFRLFGKEFVRTGKKIIDTMESAASSIAHFNPWGRFLTFGRKTSIGLFEDYDENEVLYNSVGIYNIGVGVRAELLMSKGFEIKDETSSEETDEEKYIRNLFDVLQVENKIESVQKNLDNYGNTFWWIKWENNQPTELISVPVRYIRAGKDPQTGKVDHWKYSLNGQFSGKAPAKDPTKGWIKLELWEIVHFKANNDRNAPYGVSKIEPIRLELKHKRDMSKILPVIGKHYAKPFIVYKILTSNDRMKTAGAIKKANTAMTALLKKTQPDSDLVVPDYIEPVVITPRVEYPKALLDDLDTVILGALGVPDSMFKARGTTDMKVSIQENQLIIKVESRQKLIGDTIYEQLIERALIKKFGKEDDDDYMPESKPQMVWKPIMRDDFKDMAKVAIEAYEKDVLFKDEARKMMGFRPETEILTEMGLGEGEESPKVEKPQDKVDEEEKVGEKAFLNNVMNTLESSDSDDETIKKLKKLMEGANVKRK